MRAATVVQVLQDLFYVLLRFILLVIAPLMKDFKRALAGSKDILDDLVREGFCPAMRMCK